ncbi:MAG: carbohydrate ABC transporter permease [Clostridia bacterium]|nr:carbohydrate ABC transporter permease [Clostridia bacterium]
MNKLDTIARIAGQVLKYFFLILLSLMILLPFAYVISSSFKNAQEINLKDFFPTHWTFENYKAVFEETVMLRSFLNTFMFIIPPVLVGVFMSALAAYGFARMKFPGSRILFALMMSTMVIPNIIIMIPSYVMFANFYKWVGTPLPVMIPAMCGSTVMMFFFLNFLKTLPADYEEAAILDGMSRGGIFITIIFPLMKPAIITQILLNFITHYNDYLTPLLYLGNNEKLFTVQLAINQMNSAYAVETQKLLAACVVAMIPTCVLFLLCQKYLLEGISMSGLK